MKSIIVTSLVTLQIAGFFGGNAITDLNLNINKYLNKNTNNCIIALNKDSLTKGNVSTGNSKTEKSNCNTAKTNVIVNDKKTSCPTSDKKVTITKPKTESKTEAPKTEAPKTEAPKTEAPKTEAPKTEAPKTETPKTEAPKTEAPKTEAPKTEAPKTEVPKTEVPKTEVPKTEVPKTEVPKTETPNTEAPKTDEPKDSSNKYDSSFASQVLKLVNVERVKGGLQELTMSSALTAPANKRSQEIKTQFSHTRPNGTQWSTVLDEYGVSVRTSGENIAYGYNTPEAVMQAWMNSSGHRANIMNRNFNQIGVGVYTDSNGTVYCTQLFSN